MHAIGDRDIGAASAAPATMRLIVNCHGPCAGYSRFIRAKGSAPRMRSPDCGRYSSTKSAAERRRPGRIRWWPSGARTRGRPSPCSGRHPLPAPLAPWRCAPALAAHCLPGRGRRTRGRRRTPIRARARRARRPSGGGGRAFASTPGQRKRELDRRVGAPDRRIGNGDGGRDRVRNLHDHQLEAWRSRTMWSEASRAMAKAATPA